MRPNHQHKSTKSLMMLKVKYELKVWRGKRARNFGWSGAVWVWGKAGPGQGVGLYIDDVFLDENNFG